MSEDRYRVVFQGEVSDNISLVEARKNLSAIFKADKKKLDRLFSGHKIAVKKDSDLESCRETVEIFKRAGAICFIEPEGKAALEEKEKKTEAEKKPSADVEVKKDAGPEQEGFDRKKAVPFSKQKDNINKRELLLLTFFLGWSGAHKFYLKKNIQGILCLLSMWTLIPLIISVAEFIVMARLSEEQLNIQYTERGPIESVMVPSFIGTMMVIAISTFIAAEGFPNIPGVIGSLVDFVGGEQQAPDAEAEKIPEDTDAETRMPAEQEEEPKDDGMGEVSIHKGLAAGTTINGKNYVVE